MCRVTSFRCAAALGAVLALPGVLFPSAAGATSTPRPVSNAAQLAGTIAALQAAAAAVSHHTENTGMALDNAPASAALLNRLWRDQRRWVAVRLEAGQSAREIVAHAKRIFHSNSPAGWGPLSALRLSPDTLVFGVTGVPLGTVFILHRSVLRTFTTAMEIAKPRTWGGAMAREFAAWRPRNAIESAQAGPQNSHLRPLSPGDLVRLPDEADGAQRFAIVAEYAQLTGGTRGYQVSIWRWEHLRATPLLAVNLSQMYAFPVIAHVGRTRLILQEKGRFSQFYACGPCAGRQLALTIELPARGAYLGSVRSLTSQLDLANAFFRQAFHCRPLGDLATRALVRRLGTTLARMCREGAEAPELRKLGLTRLGMLDNVRLTRHGGRETLCITTNNLHHARVFALARRPGGRLTITGYQVSSPSACGYSTRYQVSSMDGGILKFPHRLAQCGQNGASRSCARP